MLFATLTGVLAILLAPDVPNKSLIERTIPRVPEIDWVLDDEHQGHCSGIQVGVRWVLTAEHCLPPEGITADVLVNGKVVRLIKRDDALALLETNEDAPQGIIELRKNSLKIGEEVYAFGYAMDAGMMVLHRYIGQVTDNGHVVTDGTFIAGMSGGALVDLDGKLVGMIQKGTPELGVLCGAKEINEFLKK